MLYRRENAGNFVYFSLIPALGYDFKSSRRREREAFSPGFLLIVLCLNGKPNILSGFKRYSRDGNG